MAKPVVGYLAEDLETELTESEAQEADMFFMTMNGKPVSLNVKIGEGTWKKFDLVATWTGPEDENPENAYKEMAELLDGEEPGYND